MTTVLKLGGRVAAASVRSALAEAGPRTVVVHGAGAQITEVDGAHAIMVSQPQAVTDVILKAIAAVS